MEHFSNKGLAVALSVAAYTAVMEHPKGFWHCNCAEPIGDKWTFTYYYDTPEDVFWHSWMSDIRFPSKREAEEAMSKFVWELNTR